MALFQPVGDQARWQTIYDLLRGAKPGDVLTYEELGTALGLDPLTDRRRIGAALHRAAREFERVDKRAVEAVPGQGYRVVLPAEHLRLAQLEQRRASRALERGYNKVTNVDLNEVEDPVTRQALELVAQGFALQLDFNRRIEARAQRQEAALQSVEQRVDRSETEVEEVRNRLARLEQRLQTQDGEG
jgi:alkylated DNA nucleotide flippase Atl1